MYHLIHYIYLISNLIQKLWDIFGFFIAGVSVVGAAYRKIESISGAAAAAARKNPADRRRLTTAGRTGRVSCVSCNVRSRQKREKNSDVTQSRSSSLAIPPHYNTCKQSYKVASLVAYVP